MKTEKHYEEFVSANILGVELEHNGFQGGDAGHGGFVRIKFTDEASTCMEVNGEGVNEFEIIFRGDAERETLTQALKMLYDKLNTT